MEKLVWRVVLIGDSEEFATIRISNPDLAEECRKALSDLFPHVQVAIIGQVEEAEPPTRNQHYEDLLSEQVRLSNKPYDTVMYGPR